MMGIRSRDWDFILRLLLGASPQSWCDVSAAGVLFFLQFAKNMRALMTQRAWFAFSVAWSVGP